MKFEEKLEKKLEKELKKINLKDDNVIANIVLYNNPLTEKVKLHPELYEDYEFREDIPLEKNPYVDEITTILLLGLKQRKFNFKEYEERMYTIEFYVGCRSEELIDDEIIDPEKVIAKFNEYSWYNRLKPHGEVLKNYLKLSKKDETK